MRKVVSSSVWSSPADRERVYALADTPLGQVTLVRRPAARSDAISASEGHECWNISFSGSEGIEVYGLGVPGVVSSRILKRGTRGRMGGSEFEISVKSAYRKSRRCVEFEGLDVSFVRHGVGFDMVMRGKRIARYRFGGWEIVPDAAPGILILCLFEWARMDFFLRAPLIRLL